MRLAVLHQEDPPRIAAEISMVVNPADAWAMSSSPLQVTRSGS